MAGGTLQSRWVPIRWKDASLHAIVEDADFGGAVQLGTNIIVDVELEPEDLERLDGLRLARGS